MADNLPVSSVGTIRCVDNDISVLQIKDEFNEALTGIVPDDKLDVLYWMHELPDQDRNKQQVHPQGDQSKPLRGVFGVRSPMRPNPIGVTTVSVESVDGLNIAVRGLDAFDGAPIIDIKAARSTKVPSGAVTAWGQMHDTMVRSLFSILSEGECAALLRNPMQRMGAEIAGTPEHPLSPGEIGQRIISFGKNINIQVCIREDTDTSFVCEFTSCPCSHFHPTSCRIITWYLEGFVQAFNPDCVYLQEETIPSGGSVCRWSVTK